MFSLLFWRNNMTPHRKTRVGRFPFWLQGIPLTCSKHEPWTLSKLLNLSDIRPRVFWCIPFNTHPSKWNDTVHFLEKGWYVRSSNSTPAIENKVTIYRMFTKLMLTFSLILFRRSSLSWSVLSVHINCGRCSHRNLGGFPWIIYQQDYFIAGGIEFFLCL